MKLKGAYSADTSYSVGDVVTFTDGFVYRLSKPATSGTPPVNTLYWERLGQDLGVAVQLMMDAIDIAKNYADTIAATIPNNISSDAISLMDGDDEFVITVDGSGDTPELVVTAAGGGE